MRTEFLQAFRSVVAPVLRADGFTGSGQHVRRVRGEVIHALTLQGSRSGGSACVELGVHLTFLPDAPDPKKVTAHDCVFRRRLAHPGEHDHWWEYGASGEAAQRSARDLLDTYRTVGRAHFERWAAFPGAFAEITAEPLEAGTAPSPGGATLATLALTCGYIQLRLGHRQRAVALGELGLRDARDAYMLRYRLEELLQAAAELPDER